MNQILFVHGKYVLFSLLMLNLTRGRSQVDYIWDYRIPFPCKYVQKQDSKATFKMQIHLYVTD